jgi:cytochrome c biogenesis protein CcmG, thiol:disulfide interchange protein DsbE
MKFKVCALIIAMLLSVGIGSAKDKTIPSVMIKDLKGKTVDTKTFDNDNKPILITFWATWCKPCLTELSAIDDNFEEWVEKTGVKVIAISIDDSRSARKLPAFVKGRDWKFEVYSDENSDFKRAMGVNNPPHSFIIDGKGKIIWEHNGYAPGDENEVFKKLKEICK